MKYNRPHLRESLLLASRPIWRYFHAEGRATVVDTREFVINSGLKIHHKLKNSGLYVNPVIHGPPKEIVGSCLATNAMLKHAFVQNKSNCLYVYQNSTQGPWFVDDVVSLLNKVGKREEIVFVAGLGVLTQESPIMIPRIIDHAKHCSKLRFLDLVILEVNFATRFLRIHFLMFNLV